MGLLKNIRENIKENRELKRIENQAYDDTKKEYAAEIKAKRIEEAKERGKERAKGNNQPSKIFDILARAGDNYKKNLEANGGTMVKLGDNEK